METDEFYLRRAIDLAMTSRGLVEPNPMAGCVLVRDGRILGEGCHTAFGGPHAEPSALATCAEDSKGATAYITLEPCCHTEKKTPPCVPILIEAKIARVVIGCLDPNPEVNGKGVQQLRDAGIVVDGPILEAESRQLIAPFICRVQHQRPYVTMKWAQTADGKIAGPGGTRLHISNARSIQVINDLRARCDSILVGVNTIISDDPTLLPRSRQISRPVPRYHRAVLDTHMRTPSNAQIIRTAGERMDQQIVIYCSQKTFLANSVPISHLRQRWVFVRALPESSPGRIDLAAVLSNLYLKDATHVLVEPGPTLAAEFFSRKLVDRLWVVKSPKVMQDDSAPSAVEVPPSFIATGSANMDGDELTEYLNPASNAYFAHQASPDARLIAEFVAAE